MENLTSEDNLNKLTSKIIGVECKYSKEYNHKFVFGSQNSQKLT